MELFLPEDLTHFRNVLDGGFLGKERKVYSLQKYFRIWVYGLLRVVFKEIIIVPWNLQTDIMMVLEKPMKTINCLF